MPTFFNVPPLASTLPSKEVSLESPNSRVFDPSLSVAPDDPLREAIFSEVEIPEISNAPGELTTTGVKSESDPLPLNASVPALMVADPVKVLGPVKIWMEAPSFVNDPPDPVMAPAKVVVPLVVPIVRVVAPKATVEVEAPVNAAMD